MKSSNNTFSVKKAEESSGFLLWQVTNLWQREIRKVLEQYDLTHSQYVLMASIHWLSLQQQEVTQIALSAHTKIDPMTTSTVLRTLGSKGYIKRMEHKTDTRAKLIVLTAKGVEIIKLAVVTVEDFDRTFFSRLKNKTAFNLELEKLVK